MFATVSHLDPSLVFAGKARAYQSRLERLTGLSFNSWLPASPPNIIVGSVEVTDIGKHSSLLRNSKNYCLKKFYSTGPWARYCKPSLCCNLQVNDNKLDRSTLLNILKLSVEMSESRKRHCLLQHSV